MNDAIQVLTDDHDKVRDLFEQFEQAKESDDEQTMRSLQQKIFSELETHTRIEEDIFYPAVRELDVDELTETIDESLQEHHVVNVLMREIADVSTVETFVAKMTVLIENVEHHADEEEEEMFPKVRQHMSEADLETLGKELEAAK